MKEEKYQGLKLLFGGLLVYNILRIVIIVVLNT